MPNITTNHAITYTNEILWEEKQWFSSGVICKVQILHNNGVTGHVILRRKSRVVLVLSKTV